MPVTKPGATGNVPANPVTKPGATGKAQTSETWASPRTGGPNTTPRGHAGGPKTTPRGQAGPLPKKAAPIGAISAKVGPEGQESSTQSKPDLVQRDPREINQHVMVRFEDVIGERAAPVQSINCVWRNAFCCYTCWKDCGYKLSSLIWGCPLSIAYGLYFFTAAFRHVWICRPVTLLMEVSLTRCVKRFLLIWLDCLISPCFEACGQVFHHFSGTAGGNGKGKVQFNDNVRTKRIPPRNSVVAPAPSGRRPLVQAKR